MTQNQKTIKVLYIGGAGRSGSTLLEMILGNNPGFFSVGEVRFFWEYTTQENVVCGCGDALNACSFWLEVHRSMSAEKEMNFSRMAKLSSQLNRTRNAPWITTNIDWNLLPGYKDLLEGTRILYETIWHTSGKPVIVDASKVPSQLSLLRRIPQIDLRVIHLVRDGRAVAYSWSQRRKQELAKIANRSHMPQHSAWRSMLTWIIENYYTIRVSRGLPSTLVRYESFVRDPISTLGGALHRLGFEDIDFGWLKHENLILNTTHSVEGNPIRFTKSGISISADAEWQQNMPAYIKLSLGLMGLPLLSRFGYRI